MDSLDSSFDELMRTLPRPSPLRPQGGDPVFYLVFRPPETLEVKRRIPAWCGRLSHDLNWRARVISWSDLMRKAAMAGGGWNRLVAAEPDFDLAEVNRSVAEAIHSNIASLIEPPLTQTSEGTVNFFVDTEMLHPFLRARSIEAEFHDRIVVPTVVFYPGRRSGTTGLSFLGIYPDDPSYRATIVGGLA